MARITTLLIVTLLAGGPASALTCELWCSGPAAERHHREQECGHRSPNGQEIASLDSCHDGAAVTPFVTEARHKQPAGTAAVSLPVRDPITIADGIDHTAAWWYVCDVEPPRPPTFLLILRI